MWPLSPQHCGFHPRQGVQLEEPANDPPLGSTHLRTPHVWKESQEGQGHGAADQEQTSAQRVCLQGGGRVP